MTHPTLRVLVVDDQELVRESIRDALELIGHGVCGVAASGEDAVALAAQLRPDLALMDIQMPGIGGIEAARRIRASEHPVPVVFLSALDDDQVSEEAAQAGGFGYLVKPFHARQLGPVMRTAVERFHEWEERRAGPSPADLARQVVQHFAARLHTGGLQPACAELLAGLGAHLSARGVALCVLAENGGLLVPAHWGEELPDVARQWAATAAVSETSAQADAQSLPPFSPALLGAPLGADLGASGLLLALRASAFTPADAALLESCAAGVGEALAGVRAQQPLAWRRWLHARHD